MRSVLDWIRRTWSRPGCLGKLLICFLLLALLSCPCGLFSQLTHKGTAMPTSMPQTVATTQATAQPTARQAATLAPSPTRLPTNTPLPKPTDTNTPLPRPTRTNTPIPKPVELSGSGQTATQPITLPAALCVAHFTHSGSSNFIVQAYRGDVSDLLVNAIGHYDGSRPLAGTDPIVLDINADGPWTVEIKPITTGDSPTFTGKSDAVSALFAAPSSSAWEISHDGSSNFIIYLHCASGSSLIENKIGPVSDSTVIRFGSGPCFWEVQADGNWSLKPR